MPRQDDPSEAGSIQSANKCCLRSSLFLARYSGAQGLCGLHTLEGLIFGFLKR